MSKEYICTQLGTNFFTPTYLEHNKQIWAQMFLGRKQIQAIFLDFHVKLQEALKLEMNMNKKQLQNFLSLPNQDQLDLVDKQPFKVKTFYIDNIPKIIKRKEKEFLDHLKKKILEDEMSYKQYDQVVKEYGSFSQKMDALKNLNGEFQKQDFLKKNIDETYAKIQQIRTLNNKIEENNLDLGNNLDTFLADSERDVLRTKRPGDKLQNMLEQWERDVKEQCWSRDELEFYSGELWLTAEQYEKELQDDIKGYDLEKQMIHRFYKNKCEQLNRKFMFHSEAQESAFIETKINMRRQIEIANMTINDFESKIFNSMVVEDEIQKYIDQQEGIKIRSVNEAQEKFTENLKVMKAMKQNMDNAKKEQQKEYNLRINLEVIKDDYYDKINYLNHQLLFITDNLLMMIENLKLADSGIILDMKQQREVKGFDLCIGEQNLSNIVDNIKTINLYTKIEALVNTTKINEVRNQKVVNFIQDLKTASHNAMQISINENFKKGLKDILHSYDEIIVKKMSLNQEKAADKSSGGKNGSTQNLNVNKLIKKTVGKAMGKQIQSPKSPSQLRNKRAKYFLSEIDKISKKDQSRDYSSEIQEIALYLINNKDVKFELIGLDLNSLRNLDQLLAAIQGYLKSIQYDEATGVRATDIIHIDENMFNPQIYPLKMLLFQNEKEQIQKLLARSIMVSQLYFQKEKIKLFQTSSSMEIQTTSDLHYQLVKKEFEENLEQFVQTFPTTAPLLAQNLEKQEDIQSLMKHLLQKMEKSSTIKSDKSKNNHGTPSSTSPPKRQTTKTGDDQKGISKQSSQPRKSNAPSQSHRATDELSKKGSNSMISIFNQKSSPMRKASHVPSSKENPNHTNSNQFDLSLQQKMSEQEPIIKLKTVSESPSAEQLHSNSNQVLLHNIQNQNILHEDSKSSPSNRSQDNNKSILSHTEQSQTGSPQNRFQQMKQSIINTHRESLEINDSTQQQQQINNNKLKQEIQKLNNFYYQSNQGNLNKMSSNLTQQQQEDFTKQLFIEQQINKKKYDFMKNEVGVNTNIQMKDLEIILTVKKEAKHTIQALEKLLEEQFKINEQIDKNSKQSQLVGGPIISTYSETNDTEDDAFYKQQHWRYANQFPERSSNKFHPNANRNLKLRTNRIANEVKQIIEQYQSLDGSAPKSARGANNQTFYDEIPIKNQDIKFNNQTQNVFERRRQIQRKKLFSQELIQQTQEKLAKFQQNSHKELQITSLKESSIQSLNITIEQRSIQNQNEMFPHALDFPDYNKSFRNISRSKDVFKSFDYSQNISSKHSPKIQNKSLSYQRNLAQFKQANSHRLDEIVFPNDSTMIMQKINAQIVEFNPQGTLVAIGCKYASILIMDFITKEMIRCFSIYEDYDLEANQDVDQFSNFRRLSYAYLEDDFILYQKPQDEKESESIVKREFKKVIQFEPKDKAKCKAQISSLDWSLDGRYLVACFRIENQVVVWDVLTCQKLFHMNQQQLGCQIHLAKFYSLNPNYLLLSGEKALIVRVKHDQNQEVVIVSDNFEEIQDSQGKQDAQLLQQQQNKRKGPKFTQNICQSLINDSKVYYFLIKNDHKVILLLQQRDQNEMVDVQPNQLSDFFKINPIKTAEQEKMTKEQAAKNQILLEQDENYDFYDERDTIDQDDVENVQQAIDSINQNKFKIISMIKFQSANSFVQSVVNNDDFSNLMMTCSDRVLRLYEVKYQSIGLHNKRIISLKNEFQDVINRRKWMNACFLTLNHNTRIVEQQSQNNKTDAAQLLNESRQLLYSSSFNQKNEQQVPENKDNFMYQQEIFVSSIGESGSNELKFYNVDDFSIIQRLELTQEGCSYLTAHSKSHFSIFLVTTNGSLFLWSVRPAKIIQPLAPYFTEIEENKEYVEREDEFEKETDSDEEEKQNSKNQTEDQMRKRKLAKTNIDITSIDEDHLANFTQRTARQFKNNNLESLFDKEKYQDMDFDYEKFVMFLPIQVSNMDTFGLLAKLNVDAFREKFSKVQQ